MSYNFVSIWTVDDTQAPARTPVVSSDLYVSPDLVLSGISTVTRSSSPPKTTNVTSQDVFVNRFTPLSAINTRPVTGISTNPVPAASGPYTAPGGVVGAVEVTPTLCSAFGAN